MAIPAECPICRVKLAFPEFTNPDPVRCPECNSRFILEGRKVVHLSFVDYYELLDISPNSDASEIKKAIRSKILEYHPDRNPDNPKAAELLRNVLQAKELLSDPSKRALYNGVYYAKALPRWSVPVAYQVDSEVFVDPSTRVTFSTSQQKRNSRYEDMINRARTRSSYASTRNIEHLIDEIEKIFKDRGYEPGFRKFAGSEQTFRQMFLGIWGAVFFGLAFGLVGAINGTLLGALIMGFLGSVIGYYLGSNTSSLIALLFLGVRICLAGVIIGVIVSLSTGNFQLKGGPWISQVVGLILISLAGAGVMGIYQLGVSSLAGRRASIRFEVIHKAIIGAWVGALIGLSIVYIANSMGVLSSIQIGLSWFIFFSLYLFFDHYIFARPWFVMY